MDFLKGDLENIYTVSHQDLVPVSFLKKTYTALGDSRFPGAVHLHHTPAFFRGRSAAVSRDLPGTLR